MKRLPVLPTIVVLAAVATMIGLGIWQLQRAGWKERLIAQYAAASALPALDLDPLLSRDERDLPPLAFRRVLVTCRADNVVAELRGGRSRDGVGGYVHLVPCRPGTSGLAGRLLVDAGWAAMPDERRRLSLRGIVAGRLGPVAPDRPVILTAATASPPLAPSAAPDIAEIPNTHRFYALQWFFFAAAALVIYGLALRQRLSRRERTPKSGHP